MELVNTGRCVRNPLQHKDFRRFQNCRHRPQQTRKHQVRTRLEINLTAMSRGFESHRLRQEQHPAGCCLLFLQQTMQGLQGGIRTARARRFASRRAATVLRTVARARENPTACAKYHYSILHRVVIFYCFAKFRSYFYRHLPFIFK